MRGNPVPSTSHDQRVKPPTEQLRGSLNGQGLQRDQAHLSLACESGVSKWKCLPSTPMQGTDTECVIVMQRSRPVSCFCLAPVHLSNKMPSDNKVTRGAWPLLVFGGKKSIYPPVGDDDRGGAARLQSCQHQYSALGWTRESNRSIQLRINHRTVAPQLAQAVAAHGVIANKTATFG